MMKMYNYWQSLQYWQSAWASVHCLVQKYFSNELFFTLPVPGTASHSLATERPALSRLHTKGSQSWGERRFCVDKRLFVK